MNNLQRVGGVAAIIEAVIYISAFIYFGVFWDFPTSVTTIEKFAFLSNNQLILSIVNLTMYVIFGVFLALLVLAIHQRLKVSVENLSQLAAVFGFVWVVLVIASGMIANIGLAAAIELSGKDAEQAMTLWIVINTIVEGLGGGNEVVGGLWVLLLSVAALKSNEFSKALNIFGLFIGLMGILTIYPADVLTEIFGLGQIVWFSWVGLFMFNHPCKI